MKFPRFRPTWLAALLGLAALAAPLSACADPNVLWNIVHAECAPDEAGQGRPVALPRGAPEGRLRGAEGPQRRHPGAGDPHRQGHRHRGRRGAGRRPRRTTSPTPGPRAASCEASPADHPARRAVAGGQLHRTAAARTSCTSTSTASAPTCATALNANLASIGPTWAPIDLGVSGRHYEAMRLAGDDLAGRNPFKLLAEGDPAARADMGLETLLVAPVTLAGRRARLRAARRPRRSAPATTAPAEELQDHACGVLQPPPG